MDGLIDSMVSMDDCMHIHLQPSWLPVCLPVVTLLTHPCDSSDDDNDDGGGGARQCCEGGIISPTSCPYLSAWLDNQVDNGYDNDPQSMAALW